MTVDRFENRVASADWGAITSEVNDYGGALLPQLLSPDEAQQLRSLYDADQLFRTTIDMGRYRFGQGEYRYLNSPYPEAVEALKQALYPRLLPIARDCGQSWGVTHHGRSRWTSGCRCAGTQVSASQPRFC